jgi:hypothetical protein
MTSKLLAISAALVLCVQTQQAQVSAYTFSQSLGSYGSANTGTIVGIQFQDDDVTNVALPFNFVYNGSTYNNINVCANGYLSFNTLSGTEYTAISDATTSEVISAFGSNLLETTLASGDIAAGSPSITNISSAIGFSVGDVLFDLFGDFSSNPTITSIVGSTIVVNQNAINTVSAFDIINFSSTIKQSVSGTAPNRVCEFEFSKFSRLGIYDEALNFKVRLYETSNRIEFVYGAMVPGPDVTPSEVGLKGLSNTDYNSRKVVAPTTWSNSIASTNIADYCEFDFTTFPKNGQIYQWSPVTCTTPVLAVAPSATVSCSGSTVFLNASGATTYSWSNGTAVAQNTISPNSTTSYTLFGANTTCTAQLVYTQNVAALPSLSVSLTKSVICTGQTTSLTASGASSYSWNGVPGTSVNVISPTTNTTYTLVGSNGTCTAIQIVSQSVSNCTGINGESIATNQVYRAFPNPFNAQLNIENTSGKTLEITVSDALGRVVIVASVNDLATESLNTQSLQNGVYIVSLKADGISETKRFVKE